MANGKAWRRERDKGCFGSTKAVKAHREKLKRQLTNARKSARGALQRNNIPLYKTRQSQVTMLNRSIQGRNFKTQNRG